MQTLTIKQLQEYLLLRYHDPKHTTALFMKLVEEIGEVAEALNQQEGRKAQSDDTSLAKELVDVIHYTIAIAAINNIDLSSEIINKDKTASIKYNHSQNLEMFLSKAKEHENND